MPTTAPDATGPELPGTEDRVEIFSIPGSRTVHGQDFPLGIRVKKGQSFIDIDDAISHLKALADKNVFNKLLTNHGAILFRGFPLKDAGDFSKFVHAFGLPNLHREIGLSGKRTTISETVKTANEEPPTVRFYFHNEYGRSANFPGVLFFFSEKAPQEGGQTPLLSSLELYDILEKELPDFIRDLEKKGVIGRQYYPSKDDPDWKRDSYGQEIKEGDTLEVQRAKVERFLADRLHVEGEWQRDGSLIVLSRVPAIRRVASTRKLTFFNGLAGVFGRMRDQKALDPPHRGPDGRYHLPTTYGDDSEIPRESLDRLLKIGDEIQFLVPWEEGDVALLDNYTVQHARSPWVGERSLLISLWDGHEKFAPL
ncbi:Clavaminate synthase-like protein [Colletotrichum siamense]|uniref:Clavaminate synthase-like protein n=1 Tax=Colletotrichum siamense TaxID=690259 RepID=UPI001872D97D|nr:Clavaminate synthase-like protein [Colletotrichum siamense]KAF5482988.1 Clavaminate synthase-like protein [Colletotrichum siamense]